MLSGSAGEANSLHSRASIRLNIAARSVPPQTRKAVDTEGAAARPPREGLIRRSARGGGIHRAFNELTRHECDRYSEPGEEKLHADSIYLITLKSAFSELGDGEPAVAMVLLWHEEQGEEEGAGRSVTPPSA